MDKIDYKEKMDQEMANKGFEFIMPLRIYSDWYGDEEEYNYLLTAGLYGKALGNITIFKFAWGAETEFEPLKFFVHDIEKIGDRVIYIKNEKDFVEVNARALGTKDYYFNFPY
jgi:hypothetical protein